MIFWHGGDLSDIDNTFKQQTKKQEYGPGLYLTTSYEVVKKYIKGGRKLYRVEVALGNSLERTDIPYDNVLQFLNRLPKSISIKLKDKFDEHNKNGFVSAEIINNVFVNYNLLKPEISYKLKQFYLENNIDYSLVTNAFGWGEDMMVLFNTNKIINVKRIGPKDKIDKFELHKEGIEITKRQLQENYSPSDFNNLPELSQIGTEEQYSAYLDTIFSSSKINQIMYHKTSAEKFDEFKVSRLGGVYFSFFDVPIRAGFIGKMIAKLTKERMVLAKVNVINPFIINRNNYKDIEKKTGGATQSVTELGKKYDLSGYDSILGYPNPTQDKGELDNFPQINFIEGRRKDLIELAVFNPKNIHILGSKQDIEEFKNFVNIEKQTQFEGMEITKRQLQENLNNIIYTAVFFDTNEIVSKYPQVHPNLYSHHSTIQFKPTDISNLPIGEEINIKVIGRLTNDKVDALIVSNPLSKNKFPHITLSTAQGIKPFQSNGEIENNQDDIEPINDNLIGIFGYFDGRNEVTEKQTQFEGMEVNQKCSDIKLTDEMKNEMSKFNSDEQFLRSGGFSIEVLDRAAYGFSSDDIKTLMPNELNIKWKDDYENVIYEQNKSGLSKIDWANKINLNEPIDVIFEKNKFYIDDGHHRFYAAKILKKPLNVNLEIKQNPILSLSSNLSYDDFHRCAFSIFKKQTQFEGMEVSKKDLENQKVINQAHKDITRTKGKDYAPNKVGEITKGELEEAKKKKADRCLRIARKKIPKSSAYRSGNIVRCRQGKIWKDLKEDDDLLDEKWSEKYKKSIDCNNPKGFSQKAHCKGRLKEEDSFGVDEQRNLDVGREQNKNVDITNLKREINNGLGRDMSLTPYEVVELSKLEFTVFPQQDIDKSDTNKPIILIRKRGYPYLSITDAIEDANKDGFGDKPIYNLSDYYEIVDGRHRIKKAISQGKGLNAVVITEAEYEKATNTKLYSEEVQSILDDIGVDTIEKGIDFLKDYTGTEAVDNLDILTQEKILRDSDDNTINEQLDEKTDFSKEKKQGLHGWFARQGGKGKSKGWVDCNTCRDGKCKSCGRKEGESRSKYPACRPTPSACKTKGKGDSWGKKSTNEDVLNEQSKQDIEKELKLNEIKNTFKRLLK